LSNDAVQRSTPEFGVEWNRDCCDPLNGSLLHYGMAAALANPLKSVLLQYATNGFARKGAEFRQPLPRFA